MWAAYNKFIRTKKFIVITLTGTSICFLLYQLIIYMAILDVQTNQAQLRNRHIELVHGTHIRQKAFYQPDSDNKFTCIQSMEIIDYNRVNDDYCDCLDGTDEPGTNACPNGIFHCMEQATYLNYKKSIPSMKVNDGVCDCCDGSDEWIRVHLPFRLDKSTQKKIGKYLNPCPILCNTRQY